MQGRALPALYIIFTFFVFFIPVMPTAAHAANSFGDARSMFQKTGQTIYGSNPPSLQNTAINLLRSGLSILGVIFLGLVVYGGYLWMTAQGDDKQVGKAKDTLTQAIIGLVIIMLSYAITTFVGNALTSAIQ